ncbi:MAG: hypothetical protein JO139_11610 [Alphaproteobacteria bacterium]|nr:hypothetical protein [Alphaproteobacteria bacterium]
MLRHWGVTKLGSHEYDESIAHSENLRDFVSRDLFAAILKAEEDHVDFLETQLELIGRI